MTSPFKKGDTVYHPSMGKGFICSNDHEGHDEFSQPYIKVRFDNKEYVSGEDSHKCKAELLSFEPWPEPVHTKITKTM